MSAALTPSLGPESDGSHDPAARILIVDDHAPNLLSLEAILAPLGEEVVRAGSGAEALKRLLEHEYAVILMDVQMPGLDGVQTARIVRERARTRDVPIIFLTAISRDAANVSRGYGVGAVDYLVKPLDPEILRSKVQVFADLWRAKKRLERREATIRERERAFLELQNELRFQRVTDIMPCGVLAGDPDGTIHWCNAVYQVLTGIDVDRARAGGWVEAIDPRDRDRVVADRRAAIAARMPLECEARIVGVDGRARWHLIRAVPELDGLGGVVGWIETLTDVDDLRRANEAKDAFIAAASHELRTPLAAAKAQAQLALRKLGAEGMGTPAGRALSLVSTQVDRMTKLVDDLLDVSRAQMGRLSLELARFDLAAVVTEVGERMQTLSERHEIRPRVPAGGVEILGDRGRLEQVVMNLLSNAIRYSPEGGPIEVELACGDESVSLVVRDRGVGIPKSAQAEVFEAFGRAHGSRFGGLGLGLTICHGIVERHGGTIHVESEGVPGDGATFTVKLPRAPTEMGS